MSATEWTALFVFCTAMSFSPGPNTTLSTALAANHGLRRALRFCLAVPTGWTLLMLSCGLGLGALIMGVPVLRWGVGRFDPAARPGAVSGHTVVSSVNRGPADLTFGGHRVLFTAGYPALSPVMGLTHGVHGIGDTVAISVPADPTTVEVEDYLGRLARALGCSP